MRHASRRVDTVLMQTSKAEEDKSAVEAHQADLWGGTGTGASETSV